MNINDRYRTGRQKLRLGFFEHKVFHEGEGGSSGNGNGNNNTDNQNGNQDNKNDSQNNKNPLDSFNNLWEHNTSSGGKETSSNSNQDERNPKTQNIDEYINSLNLLDGTDFSGLDQLEGEDFQTALQKNFSAIAKNAYLASLKDAQKLVQKESDDKSSKEEVSFESRMADREMFRNYEYMGHPAIKPIAQIVRARLQESGIASEETVNKTHEFFKHVASMVTDNSAPEREPGNRQFGADNSQNIDWESVLTGRK